MGHHIAEDMSCTVSACSLAPVAARAVAPRTTRSTSRVVAMKGAAGLPALFSKPTAEQKFAAIAKSSRTVSSRRATALQASASAEIFEVANIGAEIAQYASICFGITLVGLAVGFVLLRVEAITEESD